MSSTYGDAALLMTVEVLKRFVLRSFASQREERMLESTMRTTIRFGKYTLYFELCGRGKYGCRERLHKCKWYFHNKVVSSDSGTYRCCL